MKTDAEVIREALKDAGGPGDPHYLWPDAWEALDRLEAAPWYTETIPTGEGLEELRKARAGEPLNMGETVAALRAAMEVADAAKRRGMRAEDENAKLRAEMNRLADCYDCEGQSWNVQVAVAIRRSLASV